MTAEYLVTINGGSEPDRHYAYNDDELKQLRTEVEERLGLQLEIFTDDAGVDESTLPEGTPEFDWE